MDYRQNLCIFFIIVLVIPHPVFPAPLGVNPAGNTQVEETHHRQKRGFWTVVGGAGGGLGAVGTFIGLGIVIHNQVQKNKRSCTGHDGRCRTSCMDGWYHDDYYNESCNGHICCKNEELEKQKSEKRRREEEQRRRHLDSFGAGVNFG